MKEISCKMKPAQTEAMKMTAVHGLRGKGGSDHRKIGLGRIILTPYKSSPGDDPLLMCEEDYAMKFMSFGFEEMFKSWAEYPQQ